MIRFLSTGSALHLATGAVCKVGTVDRNFLPINSSAGDAPFSNGEVLYASKAI